MKPVNNTPAPTLDFLWEKIKPGQTKMNTRLILEHTFNSTVDCLFKITPYFRSLGWLCLLKLKGTFYPTLVKEFYANIMVKDKKDLTLLKLNVKAPKSFLLEKSWLALQALLMKESGCMQIVTSNLSWSFSSSYPSMSFQQKQSYQCKGCYKLRVLLLMFGYCYIASTIMLLLRQQLE